jgi:serine/threonine-protein kinase PknG
MRWRRTSKSTAGQADEARAGDGSMRTEVMDRSLPGNEDHERKPVVEAHGERGGDSAPQAPADAIPCPRESCDGTLDEDRFCVVCGLEAPSDAIKQASRAGTPAKDAAAKDGAAERGSDRAAQHTDDEPSERTGSRRGSLRTVSHRTVSQRTGSGATAPSGGWAASSHSATTTTRGSGPSRASGRGMLGAGLVEMPHVPYRDPTEVVLKNPMVPEHRRFCSRCGAKVGRSTAGRPGRTEGFCSQCGQRFSFTPKLFPGQLVHGQYEVLGCLAHGGLGWIYLARDRAVADRWVVLKGLLDTGDSDAMAAALAERHFLAKVEHPNIVKIHNFVQHRDQHGDNVGYIVMEYVGGQSLKDMIKERRAKYGPNECLPLEQAIAYTIETLRPLGYLHSIGLLFCDFKPDNVIQTQEQLKLIDLGAVRHADDDSSAVFGTIGYQAPEVETAGPSVASDLYAVGRSLAVMSFPFDFQKRYRDHLPAQQDVPLLAEFDSFDRLLRRATALEPERRFTSAAEMAEQLTGVLREVLSAKDGQPRPGPSTEFTPERRSFGVISQLDSFDAQRLRRVVDPRQVANALPVTRVDSDDPAAAFLASIGTSDPAELIEILGAEKPTEEIRFRMIRAYIELGEIDEALRAVDELLAGSGEHTSRTQWRAEWHRGLALLAAGRATEASTAFDTVLDTVPGELAPKLALAACAEAEGDWDWADYYYRTVWRTDRTYVSAAFGLARALLANGASEEATDVLNSVPETSSHYIAARLLAIQTTTSATDPASLTPEDLERAGRQLSALELDPGRRARMSAKLLEAALAWTTSNGTGGDASDRKVLGRRLTEHELRSGLEDAYRALARQASDEEERVALVDRANRVRPRTWL